MLFRVIQSNNRGLITKAGDKTFYSRKPAKNEADIEKKTLFIWCNGKSRLVTRAWTKWTGESIGKDYIYIVTKIKDIIDIEGQTKFHQWCSNKLRHELWEMKSRQIISINNLCPEPSKVWVEDRHIKKSHYLKKRNLKIKNDLANLTIEEKSQISKIYRQRNMLNLKFGYMKFHVDHIVPLCLGGIHHPDNLQIISATKNLEKGSKIIN